MRDLVNTSEMYLRTIYNLNEDGVPARQNRLTERLHQSVGTVCQTVARMKRDGLVSTGDDRVVALTDRGFDIAVAVTRKHRLAERLFVDVLGMPVADVHDEACRWEHVMSEAVERRLVDVLGQPTTSPWGNPIPGLDRFGADVETPPVPLRLSDIRQQGGPTTGTVAWVSEHAQADVDLIGTLIGAGVIPGARVTVTPLERSFAIRGLGCVALPDRLAHVVQLARN